MKIFVINLEVSQDRRSFITKQFNKIGVKFEFFNAVDGQNLAQKWKNRCRSILHNQLFGNSGFEVDNEIACFASHYLLWSACVEANENFIILEDDVCLDEQFKHQLPFVEGLVNDLDYLRLMALNQEDEKIILNQNLVCYLNHPCGTQGYAITPSGARRLLAHAETWGEPVDMYLDKYWIHGLRAYCFIPEIIKHSETMPSLISSMAKRSPKYLPKPRGLVKLTREIVIRPAQQLKRKLFEFRHNLFLQV
ncbi:MAG: glycosyltransferase family 25 protein [Burkholderiales bacterium]|nr:glycosyltransferase family 25 protein [Burkholderiales bacterium]